MLKSLSFIGIISLTACSAPDQSVQRGGHFVGVGQSQFAVFIQEETVSAVFIGQSRSRDMHIFAQRALKAIFYATKCGIEAGSLRTDGKSVDAVLDCVKSKVPFLRSARAGRKLGAKALPGLSDADISALRYTEGDSLELGPP